MVHGCQTSLAFVVDGDDANDNVNDEGEETPGMLNFAFQFLNL